MIFSILEIYNISTLLLFLFFPFSRFGDVTITLISLVLLYYYTLHLNHNPESIKTFNFPIPEPELLSIIRES